MTRVAQISFLCLTLACFCVLVSSSGVNAKINERSVKREAESTFISDLPGDDSESLHDQGRRATEKKPRINNKEADDDFTIAGGKWDTRKETNIGKGSGFTSPPPLYHSHSCQHDNRDYQKSNNHDSITTKDAPGLVLINCLSDANPSCSYREANFHDPANSEVDASEFTQALTTLGLNAEVGASLFSACDFDASSSLSPDEYGLCWSISGLVGFLIRICSEIIVFIIKVPSMKAFTIISIAVAILSGIIPTLLNLAFCSVQIRPDVLQLVELLYSNVADTDEAVKGVASTLGFDDSWVATNSNNNLSVGRIDKIDVAGMDRVKSFTDGGGSQRGRYDGNTNSFYLHADNNNNNNNMSHKIVSKSDIVREGYHSRLVRYFVLDSVWMYACLRYIFGWNELHASILTGIAIALGGVIAFTVGNRRLAQKMTVALLFCTLLRWFLSSHLSHLIKVFYHDDSSPHSSSSSSSSSTTSTFLFDNKARRRIFLTTQLIVIVVVIVFMLLIITSSRTKAILQSKRSWYQEALDYIYSLSPVTLGNVTVGVFVVFALLAETYVPHIVSQHHALLLDPLTLQELHNISVSPLLFCCVLLASIQGTRLLNMSSLLSSFRRAPTTLFTSIYVAICDQCILRFLAQSLVLVLVNALFYIAKVLQHNDKVMKIANLIEDKIKQQAGAGASGMILMMKECISNAQSFSIDEATQSMFRAVPWMFVLLFPLSQLLVSASLQYIISMILSEILIVWGSPLRSRRHGDNLLYILGSLYIRQSLNSCGFVGGLVACVLLEVSSIFLPLLLSGAYTFLLSPILILSSFSNIAKNDEVTLVRVREVRSRLGGLKNVTSLPPTFSCLLDPIYIPLELLPDQYRPNVGMARYLVKEEIFKQLFSAHQLISFSRVSTKSSPTCYLIGCKESYLGTDARSTRLDGGGGRMLGRVKWV